MFQKILKLAGLFYIRSFILFLFYYSDAQLKFSLADLNIFEKIWIIYMTGVQFTMCIVTSYGMWKQLKLIFLGCLEKYRLLQKSPEIYSLCKKIDNSQNEVKFI